MLILSILIGYSKKFNQLKCLKQALHNFTWQILFIVSGLGHEQGLLTPGLTWFAFGGKEEGGGGGNDGDDWMLPSQQKISRVYNETERKNKLFNLF